MKRAHPRRGLTVVDADRRLRPNAFVDDAANHGLVGEQRVAIANWLFRFVGLRVKQKKLVSAKMSDACLRSPCGR